MSEDRKVVIACRVADVPDPRRSDSTKLLCSVCGAETWAESTSQGLLAKGYDLLCVPCARATVASEDTEWHPQTSAKAALGDIPPALAQFYKIEEPE